MSREVSNTDDIIDIRDVIARVEELREQRDAFQTALEARDEAESAYEFHDGDDTKSTPEWTDLQEAQTNLDAETALSDEETAELASLESLLSECQGNGGDEQWEGDWYPVTLVRESYFETYAQELAEDIGAIPDNTQWPCTCIDWKQAARELRMDYTGVDFGNVTYWTR